MAYNPQASGTSEWMDRWQAKAFAHAGVTETAAYRIPAPLSPLQAALELTEKDIWGVTWQAFMGMQTEEGGIAPISDQPGDWARAYGLESYVFRSMQVRMDSISQVPLCTYQKSSNGAVAPVEHPALGIIQNTNPYGALGSVVGKDLLRLTLASKDVHGRSAWSLAFGYRGKPTEIYWEIPTRFSPVLDPNLPGVVLGYIRANRANGVVEIPASKVVYFKSGDNMANPIEGVSKISVLRNAINLRQYSARSNIDFFKNSMRPDWVLSGDWKNTEENVETIRRALRRHFSGEANRQPLVIGEGATAHLLTAMNKDMEWAAQQRMAQEEISATFGVPLIYLSNWDRASYDNLKVAKLLLWHDTIMPEAAKLCDQLNQGFLWRFWPETQDRGIYFGFDFNQVNGLGEDVAQVWERFKAFMEQIVKQVETRILTPDQARGELEAMATALGVVADAWKGKQRPELRGDMHFLPFNNLPVNQLGEQGIINIEAARSSNPNAAALIESVPGAPNASQNSQEVLNRIDQQLETQQEMAQARMQQSPSSGGGGQPATQQRAARVRLVQKRVNPIPQRDARLAPVQKRLVQRLKRHFQNLKNESMRNIRATTMLTAKAPLDPSAPLYDANSAKNALRVIVRSGIADAAGAAYSASQEDYQLSAQFNAEHAWLDKYVGQRLKYVNGIDDNLSQQLRDVLSESMAAGDSIADTTDKVNAVFQDAMTWRSEMIARTETLQAYGAASLQSYREAGIEQAQMFDGSDDDECAAVDGQVVSLSEAEQLMAEEHPNGTRGMAPVVDLGYVEDEPIAAAAPKPRTKEIFPGITLVA